MSLQTRKVQADMASLWKSLYKYQDLCDMTVTFGKKQGHLVFCCHRFMLLIRCEFFRSLVKSIGTTQVHHMHVDFENIPGGAVSFCSVLRFCYGEQIQLSTANILGLLAITRFLGMNRTLTDQGSDQENLVEVCERYWTDEVEGRILSILQVLATLDRTELHLSETAKYEYFCDCYRSLHADSVSDLFVGDAEDDTDCRALFEGLVHMLSTQRLVSILSLVRKFVRRADVLKVAHCFLRASESFFVVASRAATGRANSEVLHRAGLLAEFLLQCFRKGLDFPAESESVFLSPLEEAGHTAIAHVLALYDFFSRQELPDRTKADMRIMQLRCFRMLYTTAYTLAGIPSRSALLLVSNFVQNQTDFRDSATKLGVEILEAYLRECPRPLAMDVFLEISSFISSHAASHDVLYDEICRFVRQVEQPLPDGKLKALVSRISQSKLSRDRFEDLLVEKFTRGWEVSEYRKEIETLKDQLKNKGSCNHAASSSESGTEGSVDDEESKQNEHDQVDDFPEEAGSGANGDIVKCSDGGFASNELYISVVAPNSCSYSFMVYRDDRIEKVIRTMNATLSLESSWWYLTYESTKLDPLKTVGDYNMTSFATLMMVVSSTKN